MIENTINGITHRWNIDQYMKYRRVRGIESTPVYVVHPIVGKQFLYNNDGEPKLVTIESVTKQWFGGYYLAALYVDSNQSHGLVFFENINCISQSIIEAIGSFKKDFKEV